LIAFDDFTIKNGATHLVPYSHLWHDREIDQSVDTIRAEIPSGSMVMWEGAMWHAGGANTSRDERMGFFISHQVSYLRPQEIQLLSVPLDVVRQMPRKLKRLLGYHPFGIGVDGRDPLDVLDDGIVVSPDAQPANHWRSQYNNEEHN